MAGERRSVDYGWPAGPLDLSSLAAAQELLVVALHAFLADDVARAVSLVVEVLLILEDGADIPDLVEGCLLYTSKILMNLLIKIP